MSVDRLRTEGNERVDLKDFQYLADEGLNVESEQTPGKFLTSPTGTRAWILDGFAMSNPSGAQLTVTKGRAILSRREGGNVTHGMVTTEGDSTKTLDLSAFALATFGIFIRFEYVDADKLSRVFWDPSAQQEFAQNIDTRRQANWSVRVESTSPGTEWLQIGDVTVSGGPAISITDRRDFYFEGPVDVSFQSGWSTDGGGIAADRNATRAVDGVFDMQTFTAAMRQCLEDIKGRGLRRWFDAGIGGMNVGFDTDPDEDTVKVGDADFMLDGSLVATVPTLFFDFTNNDFIEFDRTANEFSHTIGGNPQMRIISGLVGIGTFTPDLGTGLHIKASDTGVGSVSGFAPNLVIEAASASGGGISILTDNDEAGTVAMGDAQDSFQGGMRYDHSIDELELIANSISAIILKTNADVDITVGDLLITTGDILPGTAALSDIGSGTLEFADCFAERWIGNKLVGNAITPVDATDLVARHGQNAILCRGRIDVSAVSTGAQGAGGIASDHFNVDTIAVNTTSDVFTIETDIRCDDQATVLVMIDFTDPFTFIPLTQYTTQYILGSGNSLQILINEQLNGSATVATTRIKDFSFVVIGRPFGTP